MLARKWFWNYQHQTVAPEREPFCWQHPAPRDVADATCLPVLSLRSLLLQDHLTCFVSLPDAGFLRSAVRIAVGLTAALMLSHPTHAGGWGDLMDQGYGQIFLMSRSTPTPQATAMRRAIAGFRPRRKLTTSPDVAPTINALLIDTFLMLPMA